MGPLITIETVPIKIEYNESKSEHRTALQSAKLNVSRGDHSLTIQSDPISIPVTDTLTRSSTNNWSDLTYTATTQYLGSGNLRMNVQMQNAADNSFQYQQFGRGIDNMIDYFPDHSGSSNQIENIQIDFDMSGVFNSNSTADTVDTSFYPPDLEFKVVETAKAIVKYVGGPIYVPPSADPEYDPSTAIDFSYFPRSADPDYEAPEAEATAYFPESADPNYDAERAQMYESGSKLDLRA